MSNQLQTWILQWGPQAATRLPQVIRVVQPCWNLSFHYEPATPLWVLVKGEILLTGWAHRQGQRYTVRAHRWTTKGISNFKGRTRWATAGNYHPAGQVANTRGPQWVYRPRGFDFSQWRYPLRGTSTHLDWSTALDAENHVVRPDYV